MTWWQRLRYRNDLDRQLDAELRDHVERLTADYIAAGMPIEDARRKARLEFGGLEQVKETCRDLRPLRLMDDAAQDVQYALRTLARNPGFACVAVLTLALGIGANTAIFSVVNAVLLQPLPFPDAGRLVRIFETYTGPLGRSLRQPLPAEDLRELRRVSRTLTDVDAYGTLLELRLGRDEDAELPGARMSRAMLSILGARPALGRLFDERESAAMDPVLVLSHSAWRRHFGGDPQVLGRTVIVEGSFPPPFGLPREVFTIVGVMAEDFIFPDNRTNFWAPLNLERAGGSGNLARLSDGASVQAATEEVTAIFRDRQGESTFEVVRLQDEQAASIRPALQVFGVAVGLVLLIACANVANLLLARTTSRQCEMAVRAALGARRGRLVRQLMTESVVIAMLGGIAGTVLALGGIGLLRQLLAGLTTRPDLAQLGTDAGSFGMLPIADVGLDATALFFTASVCLSAGLLFGSAPAVLHPRRADTSALRAGALSVADSFGLFRRNSMRSVLVLAQVALAVALLAVGGVLVHGFVKMLAIDKGYDPANVLTFNVRTPPSASSVTGMATLSEDLIARLDALPGVRAAGYTFALPTVSLFMETAFRLEPREALPPHASGSGSTVHNPAVLLVTDRYPKTLGMRVLAGHDLDEHNRVSRTRGVLINDTLARGRFRGEDPIGRQVYLGGDAEPWEVAGVVGDVWLRGLDRPPGPQVVTEFRHAGAALLQLVGTRNYFAVRTAGPPVAALPAIRDMLRQLDGEAMLDNVATLEQLVASSIARPRMYAVLLGLFAAVAVTMAGIGIYGVMAYAVAQSTREIGVRMALGARRRTVMGLVLVRAGVLAALGMAIGLATAVGVTRYLEGMIFGLTPLNTTTFVAVTLLFALVAMLASYVPARRATKVDPLVALRCE